MELELTGFHGLAVAAVLALLAYVARRRGLAARLYGIRHPQAWLLEDAKPRGLGARWELPVYLALIIIGLALCWPMLTVELRVEAASEQAVGFEIEARPAVVLVLDVSGSMSGFKLEAAKQAATRFVEEAVGLVDVGFVAFSDRIVASVPPEPGSDRLLSVIAGLEAGGGTMYSYALSTALSMLYPYIALGLPTAIVFVTDGMPGDPNAYPAVVSRAASLGVTIHCVYIGKREPQPYQVLKTIAERTGGSVVFAETLDRLIEVLEEMGGNVSAQLAGKVEAKLYVTIEVEEPLAGYLAAAAAAVLTGYAAARRRRLTVTV